MMYIFLLGLLLASQSIAAVDAKSLENAPLSFEPNHGQWSANVVYGAHARGFSAFFKGSEVTYQIEGVRGRANVKMRWLGSDPTADISAVEQLPGIVNYFVGKDESRWISGLATYRTLRVNALYPGIDLIYYGSGKHLEYDLELAPGADPGRIKLALEGGKSSVDADGNLVLHTAAGRFVQHQPVAYQIVDGKRSAVSARYKVGRDGVVQLVMGHYDRRLRLTIDPTIAWSATLGAGQSGAGNAYGLALDSTGNVIVVGGTAATDFPTVNASDSTLNKSDVFITKFSPDGATKLFSTFYGGSGFESASAVTVDGSDNIIIAGSSTSADLTTKGAFQPAIRGSGNAFVAKFSPTGTLLYGTFLGGFLGESITAVAVNSAGNIFVAGKTYSSGFPVVNAYQTTLKGRTNGFLTKFSVDGSMLVFSTFLGGSGSDQINSLALGPDGSIYVAGSTSSADFPTLNAFQSTITAGSSSSAFVSRFAPSGASLIYSTFVSATSFSQALGLDVDAAGSAYITGVALAGFPTKNAQQPNFAGGSDAFLTKLNPAGTGLVFSTYLGGSVGAAEQGNAVKVAASGNITVVGKTESCDFPTVAAVFPGCRGRDDGFVTQFDSSGKIIFSTFIGGDSTDEITSLALDGAGNIYVAGSTVSSDFPSASWKYPDGTPFVMKLGGITTSIPVTFTTIPDGLQVTVDGAMAITPKSYQWVPGGTHRIEVIGPQSSAGPKVHNFVSWAHGGANLQNITAPTVATTYTANFSTETCLYSLPQTSIVLGQSATTGNLPMTTQSGCPWSIGTFVPWLSTIYTQSSGSNPLFYSVTANTTGASRTGTMTAGPLTLTITQAFSKPIVSNSTSCCAAVGTPIFEYIVHDEDGVEDLTVSNLLINNFLDGRAACYLAFDHQAKVLYLVNDAGTAISGMAFDSMGRGTGTLFNGQCTVDGSKTRIQESSVEARLYIGLQFNPGFAGNKVLYIAARDKEGLNSGWQPAGTWSVLAPLSPPAVVSSAVGIFNPTTVSVTYRDAIANANLSPSQILINDALDGRNACYMGYDHKNNLLYLLNDGGTALLAAITPGVGTASQGNSQCTIYASGSSAIGSGTDYKLKVSVLFSSTFRGYRTVFGATQTESGRNTGWQAIGTVFVQ